MPSLMLLATVRRRLRLLENRGARTATPDGKAERAASG